MSLSHASLTPDELVRRYVERVRADLEPDPLFRRRLRGIVSNQFVAAREGSAIPASRPSRMGRLGRACLYASFALGISVGGVMAASRAAIPGDLLYPVKLQIEALRMEALPAEYRDDLAILALSGLVYGFVSPSFGFDAPSLLLFLSLAIGLGIVTYAGEGT